MQSVDANETALGSESPELGAATAAEGSSIEESTEIVEPGTVDEVDATNTTPGAEEPGDAELPMPQPATEPPVNSQQFCALGALDAQSRVIPKIAKPELLAPYLDPAFGSRVIRITGNDYGAVSKPVYSTMQAWNADESLLLLYNTGINGAEHVLHDGQTYEFRQKLDIAPVDIEEIFWSHSEPDVLFYVSSRSAYYAQLIKYSISTDEKESLHDFSNYCGSDLPTNGGDVQMQSLDDDLFGFRCRDGDGHYNMLSYRVSTDEVTISPLGGGTGWSEWSAPIPAPSGDRFWFQGTTLAMDLFTMEQILDMSNFYEHSNVGRTADGDDALYQTSFSPSPNGCDGDDWHGVGHLVEHNLESGKCRSIISQAQGYPYTTSSTHVSAQAYLAPSLVTVSSIGSDEQLTYFDNDTLAPALLSEVYLADTSKVTNHVCRLAHHRSFGKRAVNGGYAPYFGEPHATISPTGTRIIFGSDWYDSGSVDSYVIELPGYQRP